MPRRIAHFDLDQFFVAVERVADPSLVGKPVIVGHDGPRGVVATASYEAREFGAHSAQPMAEARRRCPQAIVVAPNRSAYLAASAVFHQILLRYAPLVDPGGLDEAYADLTGIDAGDPCGPGRAANAVRRAVAEELQVAVSVCIAGGRCTAKVGSDLIKPDGLLEIPPGDDADFLRPLPAGKLPAVGPQFAKQLERAGILTVGDAAERSKARLIAEFGRRGGELSDRSRGIDPTPVRGRAEPAKQVSREQTFQVDCDSIASLLETLRELADSVAADLRRLDRRARTVRIKIRWPDFSTISRSQTLPEPVFDSASVYGAARTLLARIMRSGGFRPVRLIGVAAVNLEPGTRQLKLPELAPLEQGFQKRRRDERRDLAIDAIRQRFGPDAVRRGPGG